MGVEIVSPSTKPANDPNGGLKPVGPPNANAIPAIEKPAAAPDQVNSVPAGSQPTAQPEAKKTNPGFDKSDESSSKHKKKKGLSKLNPF